MKRLPAYILAVCVVLPIAVAWAQGPIVALTSAPATAPATVPAGPEVVTMTVQPAAQPEPALKYRLLPDVMDRVSGNSVPLYYQAADYLSHQLTERWGEKAEAWQKTPPSQLPREEAQQMVQEYRTALHYVDLAALRERTDWELPIRTEGINMLLPSLSIYRTLARVMAVKARLEIAEGRTDEAVKTFQSGFAMARAMAEGPTVIQSLVGTSIANIMMGQMEQLLQAPGAPNLYWVLTNLPRPLIDYRMGLEGERLWTVTFLSRLRQAAKGQLSPAQWQALVNELLGMASQADGGGLHSQLEAVAVGIKAYQRGKQYLLDHGKTAQEVQAMAPMQVQASYTLMQYEHWRDELFKWHALPYWQAREGLKRAALSFEEAAEQGRQSNPLLAVLPSLGKARFLQAKLERRVAALQCIEAVRGYAAGHDGKLPASLEDIAEMPAPIDPVTGRPFPYKVDGRTFTLEAPAPAGMDAKEGVTYVVTVRE